MKIEIIKECAGMQVGTIKEVKDLIGQNLIDRKLAKLVTEKPKKEKASKTEE